MPKRVDANHAAIVATFQALGWDVESTADLGHGFPDLLVAKAGVLKQIEVKDGAKPPSRRKLTSDEVDYHRRLAAAGCPVVIVTCDQDVLVLNEAIYRKGA